MLEVQVRTNDGGLHYFESVWEAFEYALLTNSEAWKISWHEKESQHRIRFVRGDDNTWKFEPLMMEIILKKSTERR